MRIAVNTRLLLSGRLEGIGRFTYETFQRITRNHPEHQFLFCFDRPYDQAFVFNSNVTPVVLPPPARHPLLFLAWFELSIPVAFMRYKPDFFISPDGYLSLISGIPSMAVIHDLNFEEFPDDLPKSASSYLRTMMPRFANKAIRIATVSEFSKQDISSRYHINTNKIDVVYNGVSQVFGKIDDSKKDLIRKEYANGEDYFFYIGSIHPRKNLVNLFKAFDIARQQLDRPVKLVISGARMWWTGEIAETFELMKFKDDVTFTGRIDDAALRDLMASALALTYVSYYEGFGIPILEAFACGTPVITSDCTSMPEVAGDAALFTDPFNPQSIADAMLQIAKSEELRDDLSQKGAEQLHKFSWDQSAILLWNSIEKSLSDYGYKK